MLHFNNKAVKSGKEAKSFNNFEGAAEAFAKELAKQAYLARVARAKARRK